jgi:hypothetical protein
MTQNQSALTTLIGEVLADPDLAHSDVFRRMLQAGLQDLINAEATVKIGAARTSAPRSGPPAATAPARRRSRPRPGRWTFRSRSCGRGRSSRRCCTRVAGSTRPSTR